MIRLRLKKSTIHMLFKWMSIFVVVNYSVGAVLLSSFVIPQRIATAQGTGFNDTQPHVALTYPTSAGKAIDNKNGTFSMEMNFKVAWSGQVFTESGNQMCFINIHLKQAVESTSTSKESYELYPKLGGSTVNQHGCTTAFPTDRKYVQGKLKFTKLVKGNNYFLARMSYGTSVSIPDVPGGNSSSNQSLTSNVTTFVLTVNPSTGEITGAPDKNAGNSGEVVNGNLGNDTPPSSGTSPGDECPLTKGVDSNWITDNVLLKPICIATNLIASAATAIASWTITTFFVPALGLT